VDINIAVEPVRPFGPKDPAAVAAMDKTLPMTFVFVPTQ
jgi:hypothetical protein